MIRLTFTPDIIDSLDLSPAVLLTAIRELNVHVPVAEVFVDLKDAPTRKYLYRITTSEIPVRVWKQFLYVVPDVDHIGMTFDISDVWKQHEFIPHREVRDAVLQILNIYPTLETIKYDV